MAKRNLFGAALGLLMVVLLSSCKTTGHGFGGGGSGFSPPDNIAAPVSLDYSRAELEAKWKSRIQSFLNKGVVPLIDIESSLKENDGNAYLDETLGVMDRLGVALMAFDGYRGPKQFVGGKKKKKKKKKKGYQWGYYIQYLVNAYPDRFILATNGGTNKNWLKEKGGAPRHFIDQVEEQVRGGDYPVMGEFDFRHYMSNSQCKKGRTDRDSDIPLNGENGHRLFALSQETGIAFSIHLEPEDAPLAALEEMLAAYPGAKVIVAHFGQIRHPGREKKFGPELVRRLLKTYPNLYYDIATGQPNRRYKCNLGVFDTVIWQDAPGGQKGTLKPEYKAILSEFSGRFVVGTDYGGGRRPLPEFLEKKVSNLRLILRDLPTEAQHDIAYRNAWNLLTGKNWGVLQAEAVKKVAKKKVKRKRSVQPREGAPRYRGVLSDGHGHLKGRKASQKATIEAMDRNNIDQVVVWVKQQGGWTDADTLAYKKAYPKRIVAGIAFQNKGWTKDKSWFLGEVRSKAASGKFQWLGEMSMRGKIGGKLNSPPDSPRIREVLDMAVKYNMPLTVHHNPWNYSAGKWKRSGEYETFIEKSLAANPKATVVWDHWCGLSTPGDIRKLFKRLPNLSCGLAWIHKKRSTLPTQLVDKNAQFLPEWKALFEDYPERFIMGVDSSATPMNIRDYDWRVDVIRTALGGLSPLTAKKLATENFQKLKGP